MAPTPLMIGNYKEKRLQNKPLAIFVFHVRIVQKWLTAYLLSPIIQGSISIHYTS